MRLSHRITHITGAGGDGWELLYRARALKAAGIAVVDLTIGEHDIGTDRSILDAMHRAACAGHTGYAPIPGIDDLRDAVAQRCAVRSGVPTQRENVLITPGAQAGLFAAHLAVADAGESALFIDPYYATYPGTIRAAGLHPRSVITKAAHGFQPTRKDIARHAAGARSLLINSPNNPTGQVYADATLAEIAAAAQDHQLWVIADEVYETQVWHGACQSMRAMPGMARQTLVVGSMSKSHAMTGSRIGWIIGPEVAIARLADLATCTTYGVPAFIQQAALHALACGDAAEVVVAAPFARRRSIARQVLRDSSTLAPLPADGAMYVMVDIRATGLSGIEFANRLLDECRIAVMPGESFGQAAAGHVRIALTVADNALADALARLAGFAERAARSRRQ